MYVSFFDFISQINEKRIVDNNNDISETENHIEDECLGELSNHDSNYIY